MAGTKILVSERNNAMTSIDNARAKWGLGKKTSNVSSGTKTTATDYNNLVTWLTEAKNKSGSPTGIEGGISAGTIMTQNKITNIVTQANAIYNYCRCNGNCTGSCTGSCAGGCTGTCHHDCKESCNHTNSVSNESSDSGH